MGVEPMNTGFADQRSEMIRDDTERYLPINTRVSQNRVLAHITQ
jgi:hypothetical protein